MTRVGVDTVANTDLASNEKLILRYALNDDGVIPRRSTRPAQARNRSLSATLGAAVAKVDPSPKCSSIQSTTTGSSRSTSGGSQQREAAPRRTSELTRSGYVAANMAAMAP